MPIYEYHCPDCNARKEHLQKLADGVLTTCPACGSARYQKQLSAAAFQLKGNGWYVTDFRGGKDKAAATDSSAAAPAPASAAAAPTAAAATAAAVPTAAAAAAASGGDQ